MLYLVFYDITNDELRNKVSDFLKAKGLSRVQYSVFLGNLNSSTLKDVEAGIRMIGKRKYEGRFFVMIVPVTENQFNQRIMIGGTMKEDEGAIW